MVVKWDNLEMHNRAVYRRLDSPKLSTPTMLQLPIPRCCVPKVLRLCHTGAVRELSGVKRTMVHVQRRFYWATWMTNVRKCCKSCPGCSTYHRGNLSRQGRLKPVLPSFSKWATNCLHWLPVHYRIHLKIATLTYKILATCQPSYLYNLLQVYQPSQALRTSTHNFSVYHICLLILVGVPSTTALLQHGIPFLPPLKIFRPYVVSSAT